jgi:hypothetical protein
MPEKMTMRMGEDTPPVRRAWAAPRVASPAVPRALAAALATSLLSLPLVAPAPSYDPWAWLLWGREVAGGGLSTLEGPAFKPLPVAACALLAPLGSAAPWLWVLLVRVAAAVAALLAFDVARRLSGGSRVAGALGAVALLLCGALPAYTAAGAEPALALALALGAGVAWRDGRMRVALACAAGCALLRVEAWPFVVAFGVVLWRARPQDRVLLAALAAAIPAAWLVPELIGSGDILRSGARARVPNPGQPALADVPALAALREAAALPLWPLWLGVAALLALRRRAALIPAAAGAAWIAIVALMAQLGFSGEPRYALPGAALIALSGAIGLASLVSSPRTAYGETLVAVDPIRHRAYAATLAALVAAGPIRRRAYLAAVVALVAVAAVPRLADLPDLRAEQAHQWRLAGDLADAVAAAGGADAVLACGRPYVGPLRGPLMAYRMGVAKHRVEPDDPPRPPGVVFRSALHPSSEPAPDVPAQFSEVARTGTWQVLAACGGARPS